MPSSERVSISDILRIFKLILFNKPSLQGEGVAELMIKALVSNFIISGIIDNDGIFQSKSFLHIYKSGKMNIQDLFALLST